MSQPAGPVDGGPHGRPVPGAAPLPEAPPGAGAAPSRLAGILARNVESFGLTWALERYCLTAGCSPACRQMGTWTMFYLGPVEVAVCRSCDLPPPIWQERLTGAARPYQRGDWAVWHGELVRVLGTQEPGGILSVDHLGRRTYLHVAELNVADDDSAGMLS